MQGRGSSNKLSGMIDIISIAFNVCYFCFHLCSWQGQSAISVDDTLKIIACREQRKKLSELEMQQLAAARQEGFKAKSSIDTDNNDPKKRPLVVIGVLTRFGRKNNRDAIRKAWMGTGAAVIKMENEKGTIARFVIGRSANHGDSLDKGIDNENKHTNDFLILDDHVEAPGEFPKKVKLFFAYSVDKWDAEFYAKVNDDVYVNIDSLGATLATHLDKPRLYIGCMKSGEVSLSQAINGTNQIGGSLVIRKYTSAMHRVRCMSYHGLWLNSYPQIDPYFAPMPMMMSVLDPGLLGLMSNIMMKESFAAHLGLQELFVREFNLVTLQHPRRQIYTPILRQFWEEM